MTYLTVGEHVPAHLPDRWSVLVEIDNIPAGVGADLVLETARLACGGTEAILDATFESMTERADGWSALVRVTHRPIRVGCSRCHQPTPRGTRPDARDRFLHAQCADLVKGDERAQQLVAAMERRK